MRDKKFRAWDKTTEAWLKPEAITIDGNGKVFLFGEYYPINDNIDILFFSGLKDKNVKDGYESDFAKDNQERMWLIVWDDHKPGFYLELQEVKKKFDGRIGKFRTKLQEYLFKEMEIIGNLFENPELIPA